MIGAFYGPSYLLNVVNTKTYFFSSRFFLHKTPNDEAGLNSERMSLCLTTKVTKVTK